ncbi:diacylglycerol/lipid kinase family protein [Sneathiella chinensis]|uniref:DAGKc domain-containing protein n=1 Tax=Sneathiella chinensis TaxID=349750 RepID=A0ABQ5UBG3_9PROT|nr:diacylglycerol kinase family protein [Sneathiella chinensis]GLQ07901.1 hypothetical protein GCM10007924_31230 [Sneathiella chinensis]
MAQGIKRFLVIHNPTAGQGNRKRLLRALEVMKRENCEFVIHQTEFPDHAVQLSRGAAEDGNWTAVVAAGGDGTITEVARGLRGSGVPLGVIPLGTANIFAREIGVGTSVEKAVRILLAAEPVAVTPGLAGGRRFLLMIGAGYDSLAVQALRSDQKRKWGAVAYLLAALRVRSRFHQMVVDIDIAGQRHSAAAAIITRARTYGGPFLLAPDAGLQQPDLQVVLLKRGGLLAAIGYGLALVTGRLSRLKSVEMLATRGPVLLTSPEEMPCQTDGDSDRFAPLEIMLDDQPLNVLGAFARPLKQPTNCLVPGRR